MGALFIDDSYHRCDVGQRDAAHIKAGGFYHPPL